MRVRVGTSRRARALVVALLGIALAWPALAPPAAAALVGSLRGTVTAEGVPLANAWVTFIPTTWSGDRAGRGGTTLTDARGRYEFADLYVDHVKIHVRAPTSGGHVSTYWPGAFTFDRAEAIRVTAAGATADVDLPAGGSVRGQVVDAETGQALPGARVTAHAPAGPGSEAVGSAVLGSAGEPGGFALADLPPVPISLHVEPPPGGDHSGQWYDGADSFDSATRIDGAADTSGLTIGLRRGPEPSERVRGDAGQPVPALPTGTPVLDGVGSQGAGTGGCAGDRAEPDAAGVDPDAEDGPGEDGAAGDRAAGSTDQAAVDPSGWPGLFAGFLAQPGGWAS